jgi:type II secretory pathway pseudopilin PulG
MGRNSRPGSQRGFTLAGVIVIMTIMLIFVAYTVPRMWSAVMQRERDRQTIFIMRQYARAIYYFHKKNSAYPVSMQQLVEARQPRYLRGMNAKEGYLDPLTGQVDWLMIPQSAAGLQGSSPGTGSGGAPVPGVEGRNTPLPLGGGTAGTPNSGGTPSGGSTMTGPATGQAPAPTIPGIPMKDYAGGPFIGVRPNKSGQSMLGLNGQTQYEQWVFTEIDLKREIDARAAGYAMQFK